MIDPEIQAKVSDAGARAAGRVRSIDLRLLWELLERISVEEVLPKIERFKEWYGAIPTYERPALTRYSVESPIPLTGIDGSQIFPPEDGPVLWSYIQALAYSMGNPPTLMSQFIDLGSVLSGEILIEELEDSVHLCRYPYKGYIGALRAILEIQTACIALNRQENNIVLLDGPLFPWVDGLNFNQEEWLRKYLSILEKMRGKLIAGIISGPKSQLLLNLIRLNENLHGGELSRSINFVTDSLLCMHGLGVGSRSALFRHFNPEHGLLEQSMSQVYFFFLRINRGEVVRVEIPQWMSEDVKAIDQIHASILKDSKALGYPYVLAQAHQQVSISLDVGNTLNQQAVKAFLRNGGLYQLPAKVRFKTGLR